jgi:hypothetical protein
LSHMKQKTLIEIPPFYIDTLGRATWTRELDILTKNC